jgi:hypothetical protein
VSSAEELPFSVKQINKAGERIRKARESGQGPSSPDLELLDTYRAWHQPALERVQRSLHSEMGS